MFALYGRFVANKKRVSLNRCLWGKFQNTLYFPKNAPKLSLFPKCSHQPPNDHIIPQVKHITKRRAGFTI